MEILSAISDDGIPIRFADDVAVSGDGIVYFSDASRVSPSVSETGDYNLIQTSLLDALLGSGTGRLLAYNPTDKSTTTLIDNLLFANGVTMSDDDSFVLVCETFGYRVTRFWLDGPRKDTVDYFATRLPGFPDSIHPAADGGFWVAINSEVDICKFCICQPMKVLHVFCSVQASPLFDVLVGFSPLRTLASFIRLSLLPLEDIGAIAKLHKNGWILETFVDPKGVATAALTSAIEFNGGLYLGSLKNQFIGFFNIPKTEREKHENVK